MLCEQIPSKAKQMLREKRSTAPVTSTATWNCDWFTLRVRSALGKEIGLRLIPGCRWLERSIGIV